MKNIRIYFQGELAENEVITLSPEASHHLLQVLRVKQGAELIVFNGGGHEYQAKLTAINKKLATLMVGAKSDVVRESPLKVELAQGISRGERMDYVMQKSVELGVDSVTPIFTSRCEVKLKGERLHKRVDHWQQVIVSACEQSGRLRVPQLNSPCTTTELLAQTKPGLKLICVPEAESLPSQLKPTQVTLLIGPEGGFTAAEVGEAKKQGFVAIGLGPRVLRTETAAVVALTLVQSWWGDLY